MINSPKTVHGQPITAKVSLLPYLNIIFSIAFAIFVLGPPFLGYQFAPFPLMHVADVFDIFTPLILIPLYWLLFRWAKDNPVSTGESLVFLVFAGFWVLGQGMHLGANSIGNLFKANGVETGDIYRLTYFYDETLGHYLWHFGTIGLSALLIYREWQKPLLAAKAATGRNIAAGLIYGFVFFAMVVEGTTVPMGLPFSILAIAFMAIWGRAKIKGQPLTFLFLVGYSVALVLFAIWGIWNKSFPGFFDSGLIS